MAEVTDIRDIEERRQERLRGMAEETQAEAEDAGAT